MVCLHGFLMTNLFIDDTTNNQSCLSKIFSSLCSVSYVPVYETCTGCASFKLFISAPVMSLYPKCPVIEMRTQWPMVLCVCWQCDGAFHLNWEAGKLLLENPQSQISDSGLKIQDSYSAQLIWNDWLKHSQNAFYTMKYAEKLTFLNCLYFSWCFWGGSQICSGVFFIPKKTVSEMWGTVSLFDWSRSHQTTTQDWEDWWEASEVKRFGWVGQFVYIYFSLLLCW